MAARNLRAWLDGERERLIWIEFDNYAHRVFAGGAADWLNVPNTFVSGISQALGVVATEVLSIDVLASYLAQCDPQAVSAQAMLELDEPKAFVNEVLSALTHRYADNIDFVLKVDSPAQLLRRLGLIDEPSFDDLDDIGIALSNVLREFSTKPIAGLLISSSEVISADEAEALESIVGAARHYEWRVAVTLDSALAVPAEVPQIDADLLLLPALSIAELAAFGNALISVGGGLGDNYWQADGEDPSATDRCLLYGTIPTEAQPELVVQRIADARA